ncbi:hypothetical protein [Streptomyces pinistramenti]|uniref:hypothetical protein n=1 Tax=Streptomyces pinistramenti TaxID=2884812 RepID=UPI001D0895A1|nr:hypothetical protein [Streptomyces pinistramenti]MCB5911478.1 hypothetical protein [Streptomyces pinistramenti]
MRNLRGRWSAAGYGEETRAVAVALAGPVLIQKLGRATLQLGLGIAVIGLLALWWTIIHWGDGLTSWTLAPTLLLTGFSTGLVWCRPARGPGRGGAA